MPVRDAQQHMLYFTLYETRLNITYLQPPVLTARRLSTLNPVAAAQAAALRRLSLSTRHLDGPRRHGRHQAAVGVRVEAQRMLRGHAAAGRLAQPRQLGARGQQLLARGVQVRARAAGHALQALRRIGTG